MTQAPDKDMPNSTDKDQDEQYRYRLGKADWYRFDIPLEKIFAACEEWKKALSGIEYPWLCWNVDPDWCEVQQRLVQAVGWTPVVGTDPRADAPRIIGDSIFIDFNKNFRLPLMVMHFPLEFVFLFAPRLAFWHSDLLCRLPLLKQHAELFASLPDGELAAVKEYGGKRGLLNKKRRRFWELIACTTAGASNDQFENACGWWKSYYDHPNYINEKERVKRKQYFYDHGGGIYYWHKFYGGKVHKIPLKPLVEGHCSVTSKQDYKRLSPRDARRNICQELSANFNLAEVCRKLDIEEFLPEVNKT